MLPSVNVLPGERRGYVDGPDGLVHYRELGTGTPIVLVHQAPWGSIQYRRAMPVLAAAGYRIATSGASLSSRPAQASTSMPSVRPLA